MDRGKMRNGEKLTYIIIDLYVNNSEESKRIEELFKKHSIPYMRHEELMQKYDKIMKRPTHCR